jgi:hypothetical protein
MKETVFSGPHYLEGILYLSEGLAMSCRCQCRDVEEFDSAHHSVQSVRSPKWEFDQREGCPSHLFFDALSYDYS